MQNHQRSPGFWSLWNNTETLEHLRNSLYPREMEHESLVQKRTTILAFWKNHGLTATRDAFGVSRATLFRWKAEITPKSRAHKQGYEKRNVHPQIEAEIIRQRILHPKIGKEKLAPLMQEFCREAGLPALSETTLGRIMTDLKVRGRLPTGATLRMSAKTGKLVEKQPQQRRRKLRRAGYLPEHPGDLLQLDGVLTFIDGRRRYTFTAVCVVSRWAFSKTYTTASSRNGKDFLTELLASAPFTVHHLQTDNGSEFMKEFREAAESASLVHFFNWVKQPKYQGWIERFNRTIQEEYLDWNRESLGGNPDHFNLQLAEWIAWYNESRVHRALGRSGQRLTPLQYLALAAQSQTG